MNSIYENGILRPLECGKCKTQYNIDLANVNPICICGHQCHIPDWYVNQYRLHCANNQPVIMQVNRYIVGAPEVNRYIVGPPVVNRYIGIPAQVNQYIEVSVPAPARLNRHFIGAPIGRVINHQPVFFTPNGFVYL
jgi:hypothetical protein